MENLDLEKIDFAALGPVVDRFMSTCQECPLVLKCREVRPFCGAYFEELHDDISMRWCCHAIYALSCMLSDGSVTRDVVQKVIKKAEEIARARGNAGVSTVTLAMATGELMEDFSYAPIPIFSLRRRRKSMTTILPACSVTKSSWMNACGRPRRPRRTCRR